MVSAFFRIYSIFIPELVMRIGTPLGILQSFYSNKFHEVGKTAQRNIRQYTEG